MKLTERALTDAVCRVSPWLAPLPTAYLTYLRTMEHLDWPWPVSLAAGLVVEGVGLAAVNTALEFREHNRGLKDGDKRTAPFAAAAGIAVIYFTSVIGLTVILDTVATVAQYAPLVFPVLSICGAMLIATRKDHGQRVEEMTLSLQPPYNKKQHRLRRLEMLAELAGEAAPVAEKLPAKPAKKTLVTAKVTHWRKIAQNIDGRRAELTADDVAELVSAGGFALPSRRTLLNWAKEAQTAQAEHKEMT
jgi:hypothetical protein